jgi:hypothetical protein
VWKHAAKHHIVGVSRDLVTNPGGHQKIIAGTNLFNDLRSIHPQFLYRCRTPFEKHRVIVGMAMRANVIAFLLANAIANEQVAASSFSYGAGFSHN